MRWLTRFSIVVSLFGWQAMAWAQTSQYQRPKPNPSPEKNEKTEKTEKKDESVPSTEGDQVDISDLEKKYWSPKDTDFSVVQNRTYKKEKRVSVSGSLGPIVNDSYSRGINGNLAVNYFFEERMGVELDYTYYNLGDNVLTQEFINRYGLFPDHNIPRRFVGVSFNWVPIYAKVSLLGKRILYFDMFFSPGIGMTSYDQVRMAGSDTKSAMTLTFDFSQLFFINELMAIRIDLKNQFYQEEIVNYTTGNFSKNLGAHNFLLLFGGTFFF